MSTKTLNPELRFPEFKEDWITEPMGELYSYIPTNSFSRDKMSDGTGKIRNIHYGDIHTKLPSHLDAETSDLPRINSSESLTKFKENNFCQKSDLIFADASEDIEDIGKCIEIIDTKDSKILSGLHTIHARQEKPTFITGFAGHLFHSNPIKTQIQKESQGAKVLGLSGNRLSAINVYFPKNKAEQQKIADCLGSLDELIAAHSRKLAALQDHKKGLLQQLFPAEGETTPKLRFPEFEGNWKKSRLGSMTSKVGSGITPRGGSSNYKEAGRPFLRSQNVGWGSFLLDDVAYIDEDTHESFKATELKNRDVLLNITGASIGRSAVATSEVEGGNVNQHVCIIRTDVDKLKPDYLCQFIISQIGQAQIDSFQAGGNRQGLNFEQIRSFLIPLPPKSEEQQKIANCLSDLDSLITAQTEQIASLKEHKKGLMQQLFPSETK